MTMNKQKINQTREDYFPKVYGYFFKRVENRTEIEDLTSSTMLAFISIIAQKKVVNPHGLIWKIARNQFLKFLKQKYRYQKNVSSQLPENITANNQDALERYYRQDLYHKLQKVLIKAKKILKDHEYYLIQEVYLKERQPIEVAREMNLKPATLRQRLKRSTDKVRHLWQDIF
jgi:RNA polymerase sigma factor (sigma-70 family)